LGSARKRADESSEHRPHRAASNAGADNVACTHCGFGRQVLNVDMPHQFSHPGVDLPEQSGPGLPVAQNMHDFTCCQNGPLALFLARLRRLDCRALTRQTYFHFDQPLLPVNQAKQGGNLHLSVGIRVVLRESYFDANREKE
jgi:hypothetical protein